MDHRTDLNSWRELLDQLESDDDTPIDYASMIDRLPELFLHMSPQVAPRLQKDLESYTARSERILGELFDKIDLSNKQLLCSFLRCLHAFGYFRLTQITYHIDSTVREVPSSIDTPTIEKRKWADMEPLLPPAGTIGWKGIMNSCLVREEPELSQTCLQLLAQKLHFYSVLSYLDRYRTFETQIKRNGERVAGKLFELIRDVAFEDERMIGLDEFLFRLLQPFTSDNQQASVIDAIVQDLFKPFLTQKTIEEKEMIELYKVINNCIMNDASLQSVFISKLLEHLKCNMIRMKRRHSTDSNIESGEITWKTLLDDINNEDKLQSILAKVDQIQISRKALQTSYISFWLQVINKILPQKTLTSSNSLKILGVCSFLVVKTRAILNDSLFGELSQTLSRTIECTTQIRLDKLFCSCNPSFLSELTKYSFNNDDSSSDTNMLLIDFYKSYLNRYLRCCTLRVAKVEPENLMDFVTVICDKTTCGESSYILQNIFMQELSECMGDYKNRIPNKVMDVYLKCARLCAKRLYKFIKRNSSLRTDTRSMETGDEAELSETDLNASSVVDQKRASATSSLIFTLKIAIEGKDQEILDCYSNLLLKLYKVVEFAFEETVRSVQEGRESPPDPINPHLTKLTMLYTEHKELVSPYIQRDLENNLSKIMLHNQKRQPQLDLNGFSSGNARNNRKTAYSQLKAKLENLENQASNSSVDIYQAIINKQYSSVVDQSLGSINDTIREELSCTHGYEERLRIVEEISTIIAEHSGPKNRALILDEVVKWLEECDSLDHPRFLYVLSLLQSLIPKYTTNNTAKSTNSDPFRDALPRISCALIRLCKSVELGPSIHAYKNSGAHKSNRGIQCCTYATCIRIYTAIFRNYPSRVVSSYVTDAMQVCVSANLIQYAKNSSRLFRFFIQLASSMAELMKSICIGKKEDENVKCSMPIFLTVFSHLTRCIIMASDRQKLETLPMNLQNGFVGSHNDTMEGGSSNECNPGSYRDGYEKSLKLLAIDVGKCLTDMCRLRVKLVDHAPHLISTYIKDIQRASCPDHIKLHLNEGIFRVFNIVDAHQKDRQGEILEEGIQRKTMAGRASGSLFEMIHARLDQASREIFKDMHDNHNKFHKYVGKC